MAIDPLPASALRAVVDPDRLGFTTTDELESIDGIVGQERAVEAVGFAIGMPHEGYNLYVQGPEGSGRSTLLRDALGRAAAADPTPDDWCYVHGFDDPQKPKALRLPAGRGSAFRDAMARLVEELRRALPAAFEGEAYRAQKEALEGAIRERREHALAEFERRAREGSVALVRTPIGVGLAMTSGDEVLEAEAFRALPADEQARRKQDIARLEAELQVILRHLPTWEREGRDQLAALEQDLVRTTATPLVDAVRQDFADLPPVVAHLDRVETDVIAHADAFVVAAAATEAGDPAALRALAVEEGSTLRRYSVNLLVDNGSLGGAPVIHEPNPTYANLLGRVEYVAQLGALATNFTLIRPGALQRANGGYLVLDARKVLSEPFAWEGLKRALRSGELRIESVARALTLVDSVTLEPEPIPVSVKVALVGERRLHDMLTALDPEYPELFKVVADFDDRVARSPEAERLFARVVATTVRRAGTRPVDAAGVARLLEHLARAAGDQERLSTHMRTVADLVLEADDRAELAGRTTVGADDVEAALDGRRRRVSRRRELLLEAIRDGTLLVETGGEAVGQVNGLSVHQLGDEVFGWPTRITARVRLGAGELVDIEREVELGGPIHSKGVLILAGYLGGRYLPDRPLSLHASLVFEQSYGGVEGDSASLAETCALLSAIGEVPIRRTIAMTGSVDQWGRVQPIGGVNEKIEGFFDVCRVRDQLGDGVGVIVPTANARHLMLRAEVVEAVAASRFAVWAVDSVAEAVELVTGRPAAEVDAAVERRLERFAAAARRAMAGRAERRRTTARG